MIKSLVKLSSLIITLVVLTHSTSAQISYGGEPYSFKNELRAEVPNMNLKPIDLTSYRTTDIDRDMRGELYRVGGSITTNIDPYQNGVWEEIEGENRIWRLNLSSSGAQALGVYMSEFFLPEGCELFVYNEDHSKVLGSYNYLNNPASGLFAIEPITGESITIELYEPYYAKDQAFFTIHEVGYFYRGYQDSRGGQYNSSQSCEVDAVCSEADDWRPQQRSVAKILVKSGSDFGFCTGSLVNNTEDNCMPYFLTADHCADGASFDDVQQWVFYFKYERSTCNLTSEAEPSYISVSGAQQKARGANNAGSRSDFFLVQFNTYVPSSVDAYFNGWRKTNTASPSGTGIHHPSGDIKKISTFTATTTNYYNTHWSVGWSQTTNGWGVTEGGSSGSPLFNSDGLVMGTLTGGLSACSNGEAGAGTGPTQKDIYGKFSYHWASNGTTEDYRLKDWLDPNNEDPDVWYGRDNDCSEYPVVANFRVEDNSVPVGTTVIFKNLTLYHPDNGCSYLWEFDGVVQSATSIINSPTRTFNTEGVFEVSLTSTSDGVSDTKTITMYIGNVGVNEIESGLVKLYPNPAKEYLNIDLSSMNPEKVFVQVSDMMGRVVFAQQMNAGENIQIQTSNYSTGIYQVRIIGDNFDENHKVSITK